jgi:hypothetical protein
MSDVFPKWSNRLPAKVAFGLLVIVMTVIGVFWYYFTPKYARVGYQPVQPVAFSHAVHVDQLGIDCRYCHSHVEKSWHSNIPTASTCMNCHNQVLAGDDRLAMIRESYETGQAVPWVQVHKAPDFVFFNHAVHVNRGVSCVHCHGQVNLMEEVWHARSMSMDSCLECHRQPHEFLRPPDLVYDLNWSTNREAQMELGMHLVREMKVNASHNCSACHR